MRFTAPRCAISYRGRNPLGPAPGIRCRYRASRSRISSAVLVQTNGFGSAFQCSIQESNVAFECGHVVVHAAADLAVGEQSEPAFDLVQPRGAGRGEVQMESWVGGQPGADRRVLWVDRLSQIRCTSSSTGTVWSIWVRNFLNSMARCRRWTEWITKPVATSSAANQSVVPALT